ncbi:hypothetical protein CDEF62S_01546 [Castellaniella defragrans]
MTLPITEPVMISLGFDPIWFGVYVVLLAEIGAITPPVGINCFVVQGASEGAVSIEDVFSGIAPYVLAGLVMLVILCAFPRSSVPPGADDLIDYRVPQNLDVVSQNSSGNHVS